MMLGMEKHTSGELSKRADLFLGDAVLVMGVYATERLRLLRIGDCLPKKLRGKTPLSA